MTSSQSDIRSIRPLNFEVLDNKDYDFTTLPCQSFTYPDLAEIYNQTRIDYIVPMPMNGKRLEEYVLQYDIDLRQSPVVLNSDGHIAGIAMLGLRSEKSWITRLGVIPERRNRKIGQFMMEYLIERAVRANLSQIQLEVIKGNTPAHELFRKVGFRETRELLVIRRPPQQVTTDSFDGEVEYLVEEECLALLTNVPRDVAWTEDSQSLANMKGITGIQITLKNGETGWIIFQFHPFKLSHIMLSPSAKVKLQLARVLLGQLHSRFPQHDTVVDNVPVNDPIWDIFQGSGYIEVFRRIEMKLFL